MILVDKEIKLLIEEGTIGITPFDHTLVNPSSLDVRLGKGFGVMVPTNGGTIDPLDPKSFKAMINEDQTEHVLPPGGFVLAKLLEKVSLPSNISARLAGKSSLARMGCDNSSFGMYLDAGFSGDLTLEIANHSAYHLKLTSGMKIGQIVFYMHEEVEKPYQGRYQGQTGVQGSKGV